MFSFILSLVSLPLAITYYDSKPEDEATFAQIKWSEATSQIAWSACYTFLPCSILLMVIFLLSMKSEYRATFWSTKKSKDFILGFFESSEDEVRAYIFIHNHRYWKEIEDKVEGWVRDNWADWMKEEPEWLNEHIKARIPPHMIPNIEDRQKIQVLHQRKRIPTFFGNLVEFSRRHSITGVGKVVPGIIREEDKEEEDHKVTF